MAMKILTIGERFIFISVLLGAVGKACLKDVLKNGNYSKVITVGRRPVQLDDSIPQNNLVR